MNICEDSLYLNQDYLQINTSPNDITLRRPSAWEQTKQIQRDTPFKVFLLCDTEVEKSVNQKFIVFSLTNNYII